MAEYPAVLDGNGAVIIPAENWPRPDVGGPGNSTDNAAVRFDGTGGKTLQSSPLLVADTTGALSRAGNGGIPIQGTNTNDSAAAGQIGEKIQASVAPGSAVALTTATYANITSIQLTPGDWEVTGQVAFGATATGVTQKIGSISLASANLPGGDAQDGSRYVEDCASHNLGTANSYPVGPARLSISTNTTVYLVARLIFSGGTGSAHGKISATRVR